MSAAAQVAACSSYSPPPPQPVRYRDPSTIGKVAGVGVESQDIITVTDTMVRDLLSNRSLMQLPRAPRILMDSQYYSTDGSQRINKALIVDRLRINLQRAANGRLLFVSREAAADVAKERDLKRTGTTDGGTIAVPSAPAGVDFILRGKILTQDKRSSAGDVERYTQFTFDLIDAGSALSLWSNIYEMVKEGRDDAVYR